MKRFVLFFFLFIFSFAANAITRTWTGIAGDNTWSTDNNWSPVGMPAAGDDIIVDINVEIVLTGALVPSVIELNSIKISNSATVTFLCVTTREFRLSSTSPVTPALLIDAGSVFTLRGANNMGMNNSSLDLTYGAGVIGSIYGTLIIERTIGIPSSPGVRLVTSRDAGNYGIVTFYSGSKVLINSTAGNSVSSLSPVPTLIMKDGSVYQNAKNGGAFPVGTWEPNSLAKDTGMTTISTLFEGSIYGNLQWKAGFQSAHAVIGKDISFNKVFIDSTGIGFALRVKDDNLGSSYTMTINDSLSIAANMILETSGSNTTSGAPGRIDLNGHIINNGTIRDNSPLVSGDEIVLTGLSNQNISGSGSWTGDDIIFTMNNAAGATLLSPLTLPNNLQLTSGNIKTTSANILTMLDDAAYSGGSINSFINGPMKKRGNDNFNFPVGFGDGSGNIYAPIGIINDGFDTPADEFIAEYKRANPQTSPFGPAHAGFLDHTSSVEYWTLEQTIGAASKNISLDVHLASFCLDLDNTYVSRWNGSQWTYEPSSVISGPVIIGINQTGVIQSLGPIAGFTSPTIGFTLATDRLFIDNPLPINLISFDATKLTNTRSTLNWELAACCSSAAKFEIQRAGTDKNFVTIGTVGGSETNRFYTYSDNGMKNGINYYRLKMIDADGKVTYSRTVAIMNGVNGLLLTSLFPTVVANTAELTIASSNQHKLDLIIVDMQGRVMMKRNYTITAGNTNIGLQLNGLAAGIYQLTGISAEGKTNTIRFIKK